MAVINITKGRTEAIETIEKIVFYNKRSCTGCVGQTTAQSLERPRIGNESRKKNIVLIRNEDRDSPILYMENESHVKLLIKALEKAVKLNWFKE